MEPLAAKMRPKTLEEYVGQQHLVGAGKPLRKAIEEKLLFSFILWGPPGVGKTTLARIYAEALGAEFFEISAVSAGKADIKKIIDTDTGETPKVLFIDEIHRFNKAQQDFLLPYVENGVLTLIGATTENPSFEVISALLSRCRVFTLESLSENELRTVILKTGYDIPEDAMVWLTEMADGDARRALSIIEQAYNLYKKITVETLTEAFQSKTIRYDKKGEEHYNTISAFIKSMRASQPNAALYYLSRMLAAGEDPKFIARRMVIFASEDIGMAQPTALVVANEVFKAVEVIGLPECEINLAHGVVYLSLSKKDRRAYDGLRKAQADVRQYGTLEVPLKVRNAPTDLMKELGYHKGYEMYDKADFRPPEITDHIYYEPKSTEKE